MRRKRVLAVCLHGNSRSAALTWRLKDAEFNCDAVPVGWAVAAPETLAMLCEWAEVIVPMWDKFEKHIPSRYREKMVTCNLGEDRWVNPIHSEIQQLVTAWARENKGLWVADPVTLEAEYARLCATPSDINEHLPRLRELAERVGPSCRVVELGTRQGVSTTAFLAGKPASLKTLDLVATAKAKSLHSLADPHTQYEMLAVSSTAEPGMPSDILFVDTDPHTAERVAAELTAHGHLCEKFIVFHDTEIYGKSCGGKPGVMAAVQAFLDQNSPPWSVLSHAVNNNGLTILERQ